MRNIRMLCVAAVCILAASVLIACGAIDDENQSAVSNTYSTEAKQQSADKLDKLNEAAKIAYNSAVMTVTDNQCRGISIEETMAQGFFEKAHTQEGLAIGSDNGCEAEGDKSINSELSLKYDNIIVYVGMTDFGYGNDIFVQTCDANDPACIGQYPDEVKEPGKVKWTEFCVKSDSAAETENDLKTLNMAAKTGYNLACVITDENGTGIKETFVQGVFKQANSADGLKTSRVAEVSADGDKQMNELMTSEFDGINVYVGYTEIDGEEQIFVQTRNNCGGNAVGQYPAPPENENGAVWGEFTGSAK